MLLEAPEGAILGAARIGGSRTAEALHAVASRSSLRLPPRRHALISALAFATRTLIVGPLLAAERGGDRKAVGTTPIRTKAGRERVASSRGSARAFTRRSRGLASLDRWTG